ncbi:MAG: helix-turn-helix domain-containing protein [Streptococcaceae bacterium]|jgi:hypothetical protein|nr:helix-turn-helix domain-containing protein [Streptococcaceae bacterium]
MINCLLEKRYDALVKLLMWVDQQTREGDSTLSAISSQLKSRPKKENIRGYVEQIRKDVKTLQWNDDLRLEIKDEVLHWEKGPEFHIQFFQVYYLKKSFGYCLLDRIIKEEYTNFRDLIKEFSYNRTTCFQHLKTVRKVLETFQITLNLKPLKGGQYLQGSERQIRYLLFSLYVNVAFLEEFELSNGGLSLMHTHLAKLVDVCPKLLSSNHSIDYISLYLWVATLRINQGHFVSEDETDEILDNPLMSYQVFCDQLEDELWQIDDTLKAREMRVFYQIFSFLELHESEFIAQSKWVEHYLIHSDRLEISIIRELEKRLKVRFSTDILAFLLCNMYYVNQIGRHICEVKTNIIGPSFLRCLNISGESDQLSQSVSRILKALSQHEKFHFLDDKRLLERYVKLLRVSNLKSKSKIKVFCISKNTRLEQQKLALEVDNFLGEQVQVVNALASDTQIIISEKPIGDFLSRQNGGIPVYYLSVQRTQKDWQDLSKFISEFSFV